MECREVREHLPAYDEQAGGPRAVVEAHIAGCAECRAELVQYLQMAAALGELAHHPVEAPAWLLGTLVETVGERAQRAAAMRQRADAVRNPAAIATGGALIAAGVAGALVFRVLRRRRRTTIRQRLQEALAEA